MKNNQKTNTLKRLTSIGKVIIKRLGYIFLIGVCLILVDQLYLDPRCEDNESQNTICITSSFTGDLGWQLIQTVILLWFIDIGLKE